MPTIRRASWAKCSQGLHRHLGLDPSPMRTPPIEARPYCEPRLKGNPAGLRRACLGMPCGWRRWKEEILSGCLDQSRRHTIHPDTSCSIGCCCGKGQSHDGSLGSSNSLVVGHPNHRSCRSRQDNGTAGAHHRMSGSPQNTKGGATWVCMTSFHSSCDVR